MIIKSIKTHKITLKDNNLFKILDRYLPKVEENSVLAVTSKIVSICEGRAIKLGAVDKYELIKKEADYYLPKEESRLGFIITIKNSLLLPSAGIDESNGAGYYIIYPFNPQKTANQIRRYLNKRFQIKKVGVIITDSKTTPLRWGVTGAAICHCGFSALNNYIGAPDLFGRKLRVTKVNVMDGLAASAVLVMGEAAEQTPLALISDIPFVEFKDNDPSKKELNDLMIEMKDDLYAPLLERVNWIKRRTNSS